MLISTRGAVHDLGEHPGGVHAVSMAPELRGDDVAVHRQCERTRSVVPAQLAQERPELGVGRSSPTELGRYERRGDAALTQQGEGVVGDLTGAIAFGDDGL